MPITIWSSLYLFHVHIPGLATINYIKLYDQIDVNVQHQFNANSWRQFDVNRWCHLKIHFWPMVDGQFLTYGWWSVDINFWHNFNVNSTFCAHWDMVASGDIAFSQIPLLWKCGLDLILLKYYALHISSQQI